MKEKHDRTLRVLVTPSFLSRIAEAAGDRRTTVSAFVREAIEVQLSRDPRLLERLEAKVALLRELSAQEGMMDEAIRTAGGDPAQAGQPRQVLDQESIAALLRGAIQDPEPTLEVFRALLETREAFGVEKMREGLALALTALPARERAEVKKRIEAAGQVLTACQTLSAAGVKA